MKLVAEIGMCPCTYGLANPNPSSVNLGRSQRRTMETNFRFPKFRFFAVTQQEAQLSQRDRAMRRVSWNLSNCHATVQKLIVRQVLNQVPAVANCPVRQNRAVDSAWRSMR